jgi:hypothetical protein
MGGWIDSAGDGVGWSSRSSPSSVGSALSGRGGRVRGRFSFSESEEEGRFRLLGEDGEGERDKGGEMGRSGGSGAERVPRIWRRWLMLSGEKASGLKTLPVGSVLADLS